MKLLIAEQDRDFPGAFTALLSLDGHDVTTVYDGTQVLTRIASESFDTAIVDESLPRIPHRELIETLRKDSVPVIVLTSKRLSADKLQGEILANAYLPLPFLPEELIKLIDSVNDKKNSSGKLVFEDAVIVPSDFRLCGELPVTAGEIDVFSALLKNEPINNKRSGVYISSLNAKLGQLGKKTRIRYLINEGYRLVRI